MLVEVPALRASFRGDSLLDGRLERFRNIKYAKLARRFALATPVTDFGGVEVDATKQGPICPQATPYRDSLVGVAEAEVRPFELNYDEFNCLNLMITRPSGLPKDSALPVVVWIHGGGNMAGSPYRTLCDPTDWVAECCQLERPVVFVSIQFRVHVFGMLPCNDDRVGNLMFYDQRLGMEWVQKHISCFGGDPNLVTLMGQSSGSCNVAAHACSPGSYRLFRQVALLSGSTESMPSIPLSTYESVAENLAQLAGTTVANLKDIPWQALVEATQRLGLTVAVPVDDGHFVPLGSYANLQVHAEAAVVSDCIEDGYFFAEYMLSDQHRLYAAVVPHIGIDAAATQEITEAYGIVDDGQTVATKLCQVLTDQVFCCANEHSDLDMRRRGIKVFRQLFDAINPLDPSMGNNHMVEILYLFNAYGVPATHEPVVRELRRRWAEFFWFRDPWSPDSALVATEHTVKEVPWEVRANYRRLSRFAAVSKVNPRIVSLLSGNGWADWVGHKAEQAIPEPISS